jgi:hypothetical protein
MKKTSAWRSDETIATSWLLSFLLVFSIAYNEILVAASGASIPERPIAQVHPFRSPSLYIDPVFEFRCNFLWPGILLHQRDFETYPNASQKNTNVDDILMHFPGPISDCLKIGVAHAAD